MRNVYFQKVCDIYDAKAMSNELQSRSRILYESLDQFYAIVIFPPSFFMIKDFPMFQGCFIS